MFANKKIPVQNKRTLCRKLNRLEKKELFIKNFMFLVDKLNILDLNFFNMLNLIFTCESCAISIENSFVNVRFQIYFFLLVFYFDCLFEDWSIVCLLYLVLCQEDTQFSSLAGKIVRFIYLDMVNHLSYDIS